MNLHGGLIDNKGTTIASNHQQTSSMPSHHISREIACSVPNNQEPSYRKAQQMTFANQDRQPVVSLLIQKEQAYIDAGEVDISEHQE